MTAVAALRRELRSICRAVEIHSPAGFSFAGRRVPVDPQPATTTFTPGPQSTQLHPLVLRLQQVLYSDCYARRFRGRQTQEPAASASAVQPDLHFVRQLVGANAGRQRMDWGWQATHVDPQGRVTAAKNGAVRIFPPGKYGSPFGPAVPARPGMTLSVWLANGSLSLQPGFYYAYGDQLGEMPEPSSVVRFYWNVSASGAPRLLGAISGRLNRFQIPFQFKTLSRREPYASRADSSVLFLERRFFPIVAQLYLEHAQELEEDLGKDVPLFTKPLGRGLGVAEDPGDGSSFGLHRSAVLAQALWNAYLKGHRQVAEQMREIEQHFTRHGLSLEFPFLNPGSKDRYQLPRLNGVTVTCPPSRESR